MLSLFNRSLQRLVALRFMICGVGHQLVQDIDRPNTLNLICAQHTERLKITNLSAQAFQPKIVDLEPVASTLKIEC